jgi:hypothetical protein
MKPKCLTLAIKMGKTSIRNYIVLRHQQRKCFAKICLSKLANEREERFVHHNYNNRHLESLLKNLISKHNRT